MAPTLVFLDDVRAAVAMDFVVEEDGVVPEAVFDVPVAARVAAGSSQLERPSPDVMRLTSEDAPE